MRLPGYALLAAAALSTCATVFAQETLPPSPTASIGCEPHGDHWHCEGPVETSDMDSSTTGTATTSADGSQVTPTVPSPTESAGCEPHGDHWHCDGPAETSSEGDEDASVSETPTEPSPTESVGCEPHGDHWHCEGPVETGAAGRIRSDVKMFAGVVAVAAAACYV